MKYELTHNFRNILPGIMIALALLISGVGMVGSTEPGDTTRGSAKASGYVYDNENGEVLPDVGIGIYNDETGHGYQILSDEEGYYEFDDLEEGEYRIWTYSERHHEYKEYFYISDGEYLQYDIYLDPYECTVFGYVYDADTNEPINGSQVYLWGEIDDHYTYIIDTTGADGYYVFFMSPGEYELDVIANDYTSMTREIEIEEGSELQEDFYLEPLSSISGILYDGETLEALSNLEINLYKDGRRVDYDNSNETGHYFIFMEAGNYELMVNERGYEDFKYGFEIEEEEKIVYDIYLKPDLTILSGYVYDRSSELAIEGAYVRSLNYDTWDGDEDYTDENGYYELYPGFGECSISVNKEGYKEEYDSITMKENVPQEQDFYLEPYESTISGTVYDEETSDPVEYAYVTIQGEDFYETDSTNNSGEYFTYLDGGEYSVKVSREGYFAYEIMVTIQAGEDYKLDIYLEPFNCKVFGYITNEEDEPIGGALVRISSEKYDDAFGTDDNGYYEFQCPPSSEVGEYNLRVQADDHRPYQEQFWLDQGEELQIDVELQEQWSAGSVWRWIWDLIFG